MEIEVKDLNTGRMKKHRIYFVYVSEVHPSIRLNVKRDMMRELTPYNTPDAIGYAFDTEKGNKAIKRGRWIRGYNEIVWRKYRWYYSIYADCFYKVKIKKGG